MPTGLHNAVAAVLVGFDWAILGYFLLFNAVYLVLVALAGADIVHAVRRAPFAGYDRVFASPLTPPVSVLVPAHDEEQGIVESTRAMLALKYPEFEVVIVDDGSTDRTFSVLAEAFDLVEVPRVLARDVPILGEVFASYTPRSGDPLLVIRKASTGTKADALNTAINAACYPLVCMVDADAVLDNDALLRVVKPFLDDPWRVVATGGVVRAVNGSRVERGRVVEVRMPRRWLERVQVVEYIRAFLLGRAGFSRLGSLVVISGAFGLFRRDVVVRAGGLAVDTLGEDAELVVRIHRMLREAYSDYRVIFVSEPVCWTEVPATRKALGQQRTRWSRGLTEILRKHRQMVGNPRYGRIGLFGLPFYVTFELLGPFVELIGVAMVIAGLAFGAVNTRFALLFLLVAFGFGTFLTVAAITVEEYSFHRYPRWRDLGVAFAAAAIENVGYRQLHAWWRVKGVWQAASRRPAKWGVMTRHGFDPPAENESRLPGPLPR